MSWFIATGKIDSEDRKAVNWQNITATISLKHINPTVNVMAKLQCIWTEEKDVNSMLWISLQ